MVTSCEFLPLSNFGQMFSGRPISTHLTDISHSLGSTANQSRTCKHIGFIERQYMGSMHDENFFQRSQCPDHTAAGISGMLPAGTIYGMLSVISYPPGVILNSKTHFGCEILESSICNRVFIVIITQKQKPHVTAAVDRSASI